MASSGQQQERIPVREGSAEVILLTLAEPVSLFENHRNVDTLGPLAD